MALSSEELADLRRWAISAAIVVLAHGAIAAGMVPWREDIEPAEPAAAIVVEFAPQGVAQVFFSIDRQGRVINSRLVRSSGASALDDEALALLRRAEPFPPPPAELPGPRVESDCADPVQSEVRFSRNTLRCEQWNWCGPGR